MARFYGRMQGARGETTRTGTPASGVRANVAGWDIGGTVYADSRNVDGVPRDVVTFELNGGSNHTGTGKGFSAQFYRDDAGQFVVLALTGISRQA